MHMSMHAATFDVPVVTQSQYAVQTSRARCSGGTVQAPSVSPTRIDTEMSRIEKNCPAYVREVANFL